MPWEKQFDETEALERAGRAFQKGGYEGTSLCELLASMGIQKGSFYATFGSKHRVLLDSLEAYVRERRTAFEALLEEPSPRAALERHIAALAASASGTDGNLGCYVLNASLELAPKDADVRSLAQRAFAGQEAVYQTLLERAKAAGEVPSSVDPTAAARALLALIFGMNALARAGVAREIIESVRDQTILFLNSPSHS